MINSIMTNFRNMSFYMNGELAASNLVLFIEFDNVNWFSLTIGEGMLEFIKKETEPKCSSTVNLQDSFSYPITENTQLKKYKGCKLISAREYRLIKNLNYSLGIYFETDIGGISIIEDDDELFITDGVNNDLLYACNLIKYNILMIKH
ncbi:hypothetical protein ABMZ03_004292 [Providencia stuartii]